ncbi:uncharacterized protein LOC101979777, partial [Microtus ochrogaster]|uniref:Uncharacterized protein LOC101979777 n=1 Tax=Microtus ochrogaster TaxID=79684 RepID=A0ABM1UDM0_MICOH
THFLLPVLEVSSQSWFSFLGEVYQAGGRDHNPPVLEADPVCRVCLTLPKYIVNNVSDAREVIHSLIGRGHEDSRTDQEANGWGGSGKDPNYYRPAGCLTNTEHPPFSLRRLCCGLWGQDMGFFIPMITEVAEEHTTGSLQSGQVRLELFGKRQMQKHCLVLRLFQCRCLDEEDSFLFALGDEFRCCGPGILVGNKDVVTCPRRGDEDRMAAMPVLGICLP